MANAVLSALNLNSVTLSGANLIATSTGTTGVVTAGVGHCDGKHYFEVNIGAQWNTASAVGICSLGILNSVISDWLHAILYQPTSQFRRDGSNTGVTPASYGTGSNVQFAIDLVNFMLWARPNGGLWNGSGTADPATNTGGLDISAIAHAGVYPFAAMNASGDSCTFNFGDSAFTGTVPSGFSAGWPQNTTTPYADCGANSAQGGGSSLSVPLNTDGTNRLLMLLISNEVVSGAPPTASGITTTGLTWTKRSGQTYQTTDNMEVWYAEASAQLTGATAAITMTGSSDQIVAVVVPMVNCPSTSFFDANGALPATATGTAGPATVSVTTTSGGVMLLGFFASGDTSQIVTGGVPVSHGSGTALIKGRRDASGANYNFASIIGRYQSSAASAQALPTNSGNDKWGMIGDAVKFGATVTEVDLTAAMGLGITEAVTVSAGDFIPPSNHALGAAMAASVVAERKPSGIVVNVIT